MNIIVTENYESMSKKASDFLFDLIENKNAKNFILASGSTPTLTYGLLTKEIINKNIKYDDMKIVILDEWYGLDKNDEGSCYKYFKTNIFSKLPNIEDNNYIWNGIAEDIDEECQRMKQAIDSIDIDVCILGIGINGHIGFNEPDDFLSPFPHKILLTKESLSHDMIKKSNKDIKFGITLGIKDLLKAKKILLLASGASKSEAIKNFMQGKITPKYPASFLWLHDDLTVIADKEAYNSSEK